MTGRYISSKQVRRPLLLLVASAVLLTIPGCGGPDYAHRRVEGETVIFTDHWSTPVVPVVFGLVCVAIGLTPYFQRLRQPKTEPGRRKRNRKKQLAWKLGDVFNFHNMFAIAGVGILVATFFIARHHYVAVNPQRFYSHWEKVGRTSFEVDLSDLLELRLTTVYVSSGSRSGRSRETRMKFIHLDGEQQSDLVSSGAEGAALDYLIEKAPEWGYRVDDRRTDR